MDSINGFEDLGSLGIATRRESQSAAPSDELGQEQFLKLMIAQFRNQDPMEPMSNGEFLSQLAQFGTVSGIGELQDSFSGLSESIHSDQALPAGASGVSVEITGRTGELVRRLDLGARGSGLTQWQWDGMNSDGEPAAPG